MKMQEHLHLVEKIISPQKAFKNLLNGITKPEEEIKPYFASENSALFNNI